MNSIIQRNQKIRLWLFLIIIEEFMFYPFFRLNFILIHLRILKIFMILIFGVNCKNIGGKLACKIILLLLTQSLKKQQFFG